MAAAADRAFEDVGEEACTGVVIASTTAAMSSRRGVLGAQRDRDDDEQRARRDHLNEDDGWADSTSSAARQAGMNGNVSDSHASQMERRTSRTLFLESSLVQGR